MDSEAWPATIHGVRKESDTTSWQQQQDLFTKFHLLIGKISNLAKINIYK